MSLGEINPSERKLPTLFSKKESSKKLIRHKHELKESLANYLSPRQEELISMK